MNIGLTSTPIKQLNKTRQAQTPIATALVEECKLNRIALDVPGHKGVFTPLSEYFGERVVALDKNSRPEIDNLTSPTGVIKEGEELAAEAFGAKHAFFMVNGTTSAVQAMVMSAIKPGERIILPRNVHLSVINAVILAGGIPIYVDPGVHEEFGIPLGVSEEDIISAIESNNEARAILINNPTYYGVCSSLKKIVELAHKRNMQVLVDEAHGTYFYFGNGLPASAMSAGADYSAVSIHKTGGSLTQSSVLLIGAGVDKEYVRSIINLTMTTSASYLLLASLDIARKTLALEGNKLIERVKQRVNNAVNAIKEIPGFTPLTAQNTVVNKAVFAFDSTKLAVNTYKTGLTGIEVYNLLRKEYNIQLEFGDISNILAIPAIGDGFDYCAKLVDALNDISKKYSREEKPAYVYEYIKPIVKIPPRDAFYYPKEKISITSAKGRISGEYVTCYPPGIPLLAPGEVITDEIIGHVEYAKKKGCKIIGGEGESNYISVVK